ncbi:hypothetical protein [Streptomyces scabiei]|uniref:hypothetical protein n=1 Tax=Streptomyces scabiei TaxID=1930 RepID=UPI000765D753|nr:hypothetical protein [Streptomyces scabiei]
MTTSWPLKLTAEIEVDGAWVPVRMRENPVVTVTRGLTSEGSRAQPGKVTVTLDDPDGDLSPRNLHSPFFGKLTRNQPFRLRVGDLPDDPVPLLADDFGRTETDGWGTSTSGDEWAIWDPASDSPPTTDFTVSAGAAHLNVAAVGLSNFRYVLTDTLQLSDYDATFTIATDTIPVSSTIESGITVSALLRADADTVQVYLADIILTTNSGLPGNAGLRVALALQRVDSLSSFTYVTPIRQIPDLTYTVDTPLRVRVRCEGPEIRMRIWADGQAEPDHWHLQGWDETYTSGKFGLRAGVVGTGTPLPAVVSFTDLEVLPLVEDAGLTRLPGEVVQWTPHQDESGNDKTVEIRPVGMLRRYDGNTELIKSAMRRRISRYAPLAYWTFEEGVLGDVYVAEFGEQSGVGPLVVSGLDFARDDTLPGSAALPQARVGGHLSSLYVPGDPTGSWSVRFMVKLASQNYPTTEQQILKFRTDNAVIELVAVTVTSSPGIRMRVSTLAGVSLGTASVTQAQLLAFDHPGFLDAWKQVQVRAVQSGANTTFTIGLVSPTNLSLQASLSPVAMDADQPRQVDTSFGDGVAGMGIGHLSFWGIAATGAYVLPFNDEDYAAELGLAGMRARDFLQLLSTDQKADLELWGRAETRLGPQDVRTYMDLVEDAARTDMGLLLEKRSGRGLKYLDRVSLENRPIELVLDYRSGVVAEPFRPTDDDKDLKNRITAKRRGGSEYTAEITSGPFSTAPPPNGIGLSEDSPELIVHSDDQLADQAGWRLHVASWNAMRVVDLTLKMGNPRLRPLVDTVLALDSGSRIRVVNTPLRYGINGFDLFVVGYTERFFEGTWEITFACIPAGPWTVWTVAADDPEDDGPAVRVDVDSTVHTAVSATDTTMTVHCPGALWADSAETPEDFPFDVAVGGVDGEHMRVTACTTAGQEAEMTVVRGINGASRAWDVGTDVRLAVTPIVPL